jgi:TolA-binding protein
MRFREILAAAIVQSRQNTAKSASKWQKRAQDLEKQLQSSNSELEDTRTELQNLTTSASQLREQLSDLQQRHAEMLSEIDIRPLDFDPASNFQSRTASQVTDVNCEGTEWEGGGHGRLPAIYARPELVIQLISILHHRYALSIKVSPSPHQVISI